MNEDCKKCRWRREYKNHMDCVNKGEFAVEDCLRYEKEVENEQEN